MLGDLLNFNNGRTYLHVNSSQDIMNDRTVLTLKIDIPLTFTNEMLHSSLDDGSDVIRREMLRGLEVSFKDLKEHLKKL